MLSKLRLQILLEMTSEVGLLNTRPRGKLANNLELVSDEVIL